LSALCPSQQPTVLFSIYQNNFWTIRRLVYETIDPVTQPILLKIVGSLLGKIRANLIYIPLQPDYLDQIRRHSLDLSTHEYIAYCSRASGYISQSFPNQNQSLLNSGLTLIDMSHETKKYGHF
jgi:hypothetical protein